MKASRIAPTLPPPLPRLFDFPRARFRFRSVPYLGLLSMTLPSLRSILDRYALGINVSRLFRPT